MIIVFLLFILVINGRFRWSEPKSSGGIIRWDRGRVNDVGRSKATGSVHQEKRAKRL